MPIEHLCVGRGLFFRIVVHLPTIRWMVLGFGVFCGLVSGS